MKIGILGGTFSPVHKGHINMALAAKEQLKLDKVLFMPTGNPPHKKNIIDVRHRLNMLELALRDYSNLQVSDFEAKREGIIYTADTLELLSESNPENEYTFIIGADSLFYIDKWYQPERIFKYSDIAVCSRDGSGKRELLNKIEELKQTYNPRIKILEFEEVTISSKEIRDFFANKSEKDNEILKRYVPEDVIDYIEKEGLYNE